MKVKPDGGVIMVAEEKCDGGLNANALTPERPPSVSPPTPVLLMPVMLRVNRSTSGLDVVNCVSV
jgi:hypothetical protein